LKIKSAQHRKLHPVLKTRYAEFVGYYRLSKNRNHKTSNTVKSPTAIETPAVSEELENISKIKWCAAKALRWKRGIPTEPLLTKWLHTEDYQVKIELEGALATIPNPKVFPVLLKALCETKQQSENIVKRRIDNLKLWYVLLGNERDAFMADILKNLPQEKQGSVIFWLRDTSTFAFFREPPRIAKGWFATIEDKSDGISPIVPQEIREIFISLSADFPA
jgi:hypothetical protein